MISFLVCCYVVNDDKNLIPSSQIQKIPKICASCQQFHQDHNNNIATMITPSSVSPTIPVADLAALTLGPKVHQAEHIHPQLPFRFSGFKCSGILVPKHGDHHKATKNNAGTMGSHRLEHAHFYSAWAADFESESNGIYVFTLPFRFVLPDAYDYQFLLYLPSRLLPHHFANVVRLTMREGCVNVAGWIDVANVYSPSEKAFRIHLLVKKRDFLKHVQCGH